MTRDLRPPEQDETPLTPEEVNIGLREGILEGPIARKMQRDFREVFVVQRKVVQVVDFYEGEEK